MSDDKDKVTVDQPCPPDPQATGVIIKFVTQSVIAVVSLGVVGYAVLSGLQVPEAFIALLSVIVGWYFGKNGSGFAEAITTRTKKK